MHPLSVRTLLEFNENTLRENSFDDAWMIQKQQETSVALNELEKRLKYVDSLDSFQERWLEIAKGVLAGNMFDWGAKAVTDIMEVSSDFGLVQAMNTIQKRPWFRDDLDLWIIRIQVFKNILLYIFLTISLSV